MVVGGYTGIPSGEIINEVEILDPFINNTNAILPPFPDYRVNAVGQLYNQKPLICGGKDKDAYKDDCYEYYNNTWTKSDVSLNEVRRGASSVVVKENIIWVSGGVGDDRSPLSSTDLIHSNDPDFLKAVDLPRNMSSHCSATFNETYVFIAGNFQDGAENGAYLVNTMSEPYAFTQLPNMSYGHYGAACGTIKHHNETKLVVAGGGIFDPPNSLSLSSVELYSFTTGEWEEGPVLPRGFQYGSSLYYPNPDTKSLDLILIGGLDGNLNGQRNIMWYNEAEAEFKILDLELKTERSEFCAFLIEM